MMRRDDAALAVALEAAAASLPASRRTVALALGRRLRSPARLLLLGPECAEKTALLALIGGFATLSVEAVSVEDCTEGDLAAADLLVICDGASVPWLPGVLAICPEALLDHALFAMTGAEEIAAAGRLEAAIAALSGLLGGRGVAIFPIAAARALEARRRGDRQALRASGAEALLDRLEKMILLGREAVADSAMMLLHSIGTLPPGAPGRPGAVPARATEKTPSPKPVTRSAKDAEDPPPALAGDAICDVVSDAATTGSTSWRALLHLIEADTASLAAALEAAGQSEPVDERNLSRITLRQVCTMAERISEACLAATDLPLRSEIQILADTVWLLQAEGGIAAATEALDLLNQIRVDVASRCPTEGAER